MNEKKEFVSRRHFVRDASFAGATMLAVPNVSTSREKAKVLTVGEGEFLYEVEHGGICRRVTDTVCSSEAGRFAQLLRRTQGRRPCRQIIEEKATSDSIVYTDSFRVYKALEVSDFHHMRINHFDLFANRENHINGIENFWNQAKRHLRKFNGIDRDSFHWFLKECEWHFNGGNHQNLYEQLQHWNSKSKHQPLATSAP